MNKVFWIPLFLALSCTQSKNDKHVNLDTDKTSPKNTIEDFNYPLLVDGKHSVKFKDGDIVFIHSGSDLSFPISLATESEYTHCAIYWCFKGTGPAFYEASAKVEITNFDNFLKDRKGSLLLVMRLKDRDKLLDSLHLSQVINKISSWHNRPYDGQFLWSDDKLYCSELVYKAYEAANIELCKVKRLRDFDLTSPMVKSELEKRFGDDIPLNESVVAPVDLIYSNLLDTIYYSK